MSRPSSIDATRVHLTMTWVVSCHEFGVSEALAPTPSSKKKPPLASLTETSAAAYHHRKAQRTKNPLLVDLLVRKRDLHQGTILPGDLLLELAELVRLNFGLSVSSPQFDLALLVGFCCGTDHFAHLVQVLLLLELRFPFGSSSFWNWPICMSPA